MINKLSVEDIECYAYHGCLDEEARIGGRFRVDVYIEMNMDLAIKSDDLSGTVDYVFVNKIVREQMAIRSKLIEHVAGRIMMELHRAFPGEKMIEVKVTKFNPPVNSQIGLASITLRETYL